MVIKFVLNTSYYLAEESFKDEIIESSKFYFKTKEHTFIFQNGSDTDSDYIELDFTYISNIVRNADNLDKTKKYFGFWYYGEGMTNELKNWKAILDLGIKVYTSTWEPELLSHPNYVYDISFSFHYFNFINGSCYIERTDVEKISYPKKYKVGLYGISKWKENSKTIRNWRNQYVEYFENKSDTKTIRYARPSIFELSQSLRNQHFSAPFDFRYCSYFLTAETHFNLNNHLPYFTSEKVLKSAWLELFDINTMLITSPLHMKDLHDAGFVFANSKFIKEYTSESIMNSLFECYETSEIIQTNNLSIVDKILSENVFNKHNILWT
jgi:hypothetical protein